MKKVRKEYTVKIDYVQVKEIFQSNYFDTP